MAIRGSGSKFSEVKQQIDDACAGGSDLMNQGISRNPITQNVNCDVAKEVVVIADKILEVEGGRDSAVRPSAQVAVGKPVEGTMAGFSTVAEKLHIELKDKNPWVDTISDNRLLDKGLKMRFMAPMIIDGLTEVEIESSDTISETDYWKNGLILFAIGEELSMNAIKQFIGRAWRFVAMPEIYYHEDGYFIVRFLKSEDREEVLKRGPYTIFSSPLFMRKWTKDFIKTDQMMCLMPI